MTYGALSAASIVNAVGYDDDDTLHRSVVQWIIGLTRNHHIKVAGTSIHAIGIVGIPPSETRKCLEDLIQTDRRPDDFELVTCRGTAFRCLAAIDRQLAFPYLDTPACRDHITLVSHWLDERPNDRQFIDELTWMQAK